MANVFEKADKFAGTALALLQKEIKGAGLFVHRYGVADYSGAKGDTIMIKRPPILAARDAGFRERNALVVDSIVQSKIAVQLDRHPYSRVELSPEEATLDEVNYVRDVQAPQVRALVEDFDNSIAGALAAATFVNTVAYDGATGDPRKVARKAKRYLDAANVPAAGRYWLVGAAVSEAIASLDKLLDVNTAGIPEALREGVVGRLAGFTIIDWPALEDDESYFVHETAVAISAVAPVVPRGAASGATIAGNGLAVTQVWDYQSETLADQSTVHAFTGATPVVDPKILTEAKDADSTAGTPAQRKGEIEVDKDGEPVMQFVRGVKVTFTEATDSTGE